MLRVVPGDPPNVDPEVLCQQIVDHPADVVPAVAKDEEFLPLSEAAVVAEVKDDVAEVLLLRVLPFDVSEGLLNRLPGLALREGVHLQRCSWPRNAR